MQDWGMVVIADGLEGYVCDGSGKVIVFPTYEMALQEAVKVLTEYACCLVRADNVVFAILPSRILRMRTINFAPEDD